MVATDEHAYSQERPRRPRARPRGQFLRGTYDQVDALADWIDAKGRRLSHIYITHGHGDHWLGLARPGPADPALSRSDGPGHG
jgi:glyoxylase-like metal-dependent hydrolase (beta-lactamase superfamily II)